MIEFTDWAVQILTRSQEAAQRFNSSAKLRMSEANGRIEFTITDEPAPSDRIVRGEGFTLYAAEGLEGIVDVEEPHDRLVLRPSGSDVRSVPHDPRPARGAGG
jgi:hypothetical protein